jgi:hypothetical protein
VKIFEADLKRLNGNIVSYKEKKPDLTQQELDERTDVVNRLREALKLFKYDYEEQTRIFEQGSGAPAKKKVKIMVNDQTNDEFLERSHLQTDDPIVDRKQALSRETAEQTEFDFDRNLEGVQKSLESLEKQFLMNDFDINEAVQWHLGDHMTHSYYLDTISAIKTTRSCFFDMLLIVFTYVWIMAGLHLLREKNYIPNYHHRWTLNQRF